MCRYLKMGNLDISFGWNDNRGVEHPPAAPRRATLVGPRTTGLQRSAKVGKGRNTFRFRSAPPSPAALQRHRERYTPTPLYYSQCLPMPPNAGRSCAHIA